MNSGGIDVRREGLHRMQLNQLLVAVVLAIAIGAPIAGFLGGANVAQPIPSTELRIPLRHGFPTKFAGQSELACLVRADEWLEFAALDAAGSARESHRGDFWTYTSIGGERLLYLSLVREVSQSRTGRDWHSCAGLRRGV
jgi:hypothetical protein